MPFCPIRFEPSLNIAVGWRSALLDGCARAGSGPIPPAMRRLLLAALIFLAIGPVPGMEQRRWRDVRIDRASAHRLDVPAEDAGMMRFVRGWHLVSPHSRFGGFSAVAKIGPDRFQLVGDNGWWTRLTLHPDGRLSDVRIRLLPTPGGGADRKKLSDVEAMQVDPATGRSWMALERVNEVRRFDAALTRIESHARLPGAAWPANSGAEAMVRLKDGRWLVFSEDARGPRGREALLYDGDPAVPGTRATRFFYDSQGRGLVSDAAVLPDGRVLLIHRRLGIKPIFTTIVALAEPADIAPGGTLTARTIGRVPAALADNFEGAVVSSEQGRTFLWLVSDNNFNRWQRSLLLQFELVGLPPDNKKAAR